MLHLQRRQKPRFPGAGLACRFGRVSHFGRMYCGGKDMRGEVLHYDEDQGFGFIVGADGSRYSFAREDMRRDASVAKGALVEFQPGGGQARNVYSIRTQASAAPAGAAATPPQVSSKPAAAASQPQHFGRLAENETGGSTGLWSYFWRAVTENYVNFAGRARRKEFWAFCLFWMVSLIVIFGIGVAADAAMGNLDAGTDLPAMAMGLSITFILATFVPWIGLIVRRLHDIGLTGWLAVLFFIPTVGGLATLVFALIPTQGQENRWGPVPAGVRV